MTFPLITTSRWEIEEAHTLDGYLKTGGYEALAKALNMAPSAVHDEVKEASLLG